MIKLLHGKMKKERPVTVNLDKALLRKLKIYCVGKNISMKSFVEKIIKEKIK